MKHVDYKEIYSNLNQQKFYFKILENCFVEKNHLKISYSY